MTAFGTLDRNLAFPPRHPQLLAALGAFKYLILLALLPAHINPIIPRFYIINQLHQHEIFFATLINFL